MFQATKISAPAMNSLRLRKLGTRRRFRAQLPALGEELAAASREPLFRD